MTGINEWIDAAQRRCDAATEGPWGVVASEIRGQVGYSVKSATGTVVLFGGFGPRGGPQESDAVLATHARTDLPTALAALTDLLNACDESVEGIVEVYGTDDMAVAVLTVDEVRSIIATALGVAP